MNSKLKIVKKNNNVKVPPGGELSGVGFSLYEIISTHAAEGFLIGQVGVVK
jgi:hypothetical protein